MTAYDSPVTRDQTVRHAAGRREFLALVTALMATSALAIDFSLPAFPDIRAEFGMSPDATTVGTLVTVFFQIGRAHV